MKKKCLVWILLLLLLSLTFPVFAEGDASICAVDGYSVSANLAVSGNSILCQAKILLQKGFTAKVTIVLQKQTATGGRCIVAAQSSAQGASSVTLSYPAEAGTYRLKATATIYNASGVKIDTLSKFSGTVTKK